MREVAVVAAGGAIGASMRYLVALALASESERLIPWYTLVANVSGAFLLGIVFTLISERSMLSETWLLFLGVGVLGGYTTFSTFSRFIATLRDRPPAERTPSAPKSNSRSTSPTTPMQIAESEHPCASFTWTKSSTTR